MDRVPAERWDAIRGALSRWGLLLAQDATLPSVTTLAAGTVIRGSWWPHPENGAVYDAFGRLAREGVFSARLLDGKWTYVRADLVPAVDGIATSGEAWQRDGLSGDARALLERLRRGEIVRSDEAADRDARRALARAADDLERRLLATSDQVHTEGGHHARVVRLWRCAGESPFTSREARRLLERMTAALNDAHDGRARLPWGDSPYRRPAATSSTMLR